MLEFVAELAWTLSRTYSTSTIVRPIMFNIAVPHSYDLLRQDLHWKERCNHQDGVSEDKVIDKYHRGRSSPVLTCFVWIEILQPCSASGKVGVSRVKKGSNIKCPGRDIAWKLVHWKQVE